MKTLDDVAAMLERIARRDFETASALRIAARHEPAREFEATGEIYARAAAVIRKHIEAAG